MRDRLVGADRPAELLALGDVLDAELERLLRDPDRLEREQRRAGAAGGSKSPSSASPSSRAEPRAAGSRPRSRASRPRPEPSSCRRAAPGRPVQARHQLVERERPGLLGDLGQRGQDDGGRQERARVERAAGLLDQDRLLEEAEPGAAPLLGDRDAEPAQLAQLGQSALRVRLEERARLAAQLLLLGVKATSTQRLRGRPSTRSATMLRRISEVPASIVLPRLRSCWCCQ